MLDHWGRLAIGIAPLEFSWVLLSFLEFSEFFWVFRDFKILQTLFWVDSKLFLIGFGFLSCMITLYRTGMLWNSELLVFRISLLEFLEFSLFGGPSTIENFQKVYPERWLIRTCNNIPNIFSKSLRTWCFEIFGSKNLEVGFHQLNSLGGNHRFPPPNPEAQQIGALKGEVITVMKWSFSKTIRS